MKSDKAPKGAAKSGEDRDGKSAERGKDEKSGSSSYIPPDPTKDKQLAAALDQVRGIKRDASTAPAVDAPKPN